MQPELLGDPEYKGDLQAALNGYFSEIRTTTQMRDIEWEALKVAIQGQSLGKSYGIRKKLEQELTKQEGILTTLQSREGKSNVDEASHQKAHRRIGVIWNRLDSYVSKDYRQQLHPEGDRWGHMLAWFLKCE
ncbi:hypothetical protein NDU88_002428 [Pleurodeles waltl]|uniref:Uncharacterized protein n=1 Tax=Pleurodeles waltl TaxID=8319 RepID=A0AAV7KST2_PLEWA|nr:hypothetical protein NDU88_002428 [Pleurodeles waltl]